MSKIQFQPQAAIVEPNTSLEEFTEYLELCLNIQRDILWQIGDISRAMERQHPNTFHQGYPVKVSPDLISRCQAISAAYKITERNIDATWTVHQHLSKRPDRVAAVAASVEGGQTSDEARKNPPPPQVEEPKPDPVPPKVETQPAVTQKEEEPVRKGWLLAVDLNYYLKRSHVSDGVETAANVCGWLQRFIERLSDRKSGIGVTDVVICFDSTTNHRRALTEGWEKPYKNRSKKDPEFISQLVMAREILTRMGYACVDMDGMESDDLMASYAVQFDGMVSLMTVDADLRQCLKPGKCNILIDTKWEQHPETGTWRHVDYWVNTEKHIKEGCAKYTYDKASYVTGITPEQWPHFQALAGDPTDDIAGCVGVGAKHACDLIKAHGTVQGVIAACKDNTADLSQRLRLKVLDFEPLAETTLKLTTMRTDLPVPQTTRISMKAD